MKARLASLALAAVLTAATFAADTPPNEAPLDDDAWARLRADTLARPLRTIYNNDSWDFTSAPDDFILTRENLYARQLDKLKGSQIDVVSLCPGGAGLTLTTRTKATEFVAGFPPPAGKRLLAPELHAMGTDCLQLTVEFCRENGFRPFACLRVNDTHDAFARRSKLKEEHPEQLVGERFGGQPYAQWSGFDFSHREVRERVTAIVREFVSDYDIDGVELDFYRYPCFFRSVAWGGTATEEERALMTEMMRAIRKEVDAVGRRKGRYFLIGARVPDASAVAREIGLDIETWMREGLIDLCLLGGDYGHFATFADAIALAHKYGVKAFPSVDASWIGGERTRAVGYNAQAAAALAAGADGIYYFNLCYFLDYVPQLRRSLEDLKFASKSYFGYYEDFGPLAHRLEECDTLKRRRGDGLWVAPGRGDAMLMEVGDDLSTADVQAAKPAARLVVTTNQPTRHALKAAVNGVALGAPEFAPCAGTYTDRGGELYRAGRYTYQVPLSAVRKGVNEITFSLDEEKLRLAPMRILQGDAVPPRDRMWGWWHVFFGRARPRAVEVVPEEKALRIEDSGGTNEHANLLYLLPFQAAQMRVEGDFEMKLEYATAPESVVLRLANGVVAEIIDFQKDKIRVVGAGATAAFRTDDAFHRYHFIMEGSAFELSADGRPLLKCRLPVAADSKEAFLPDVMFTVPGMHRRGLLIGSLSGLGKGAAHWRNFTLDYNGLLLTDVCLKIDF